MTIMIAGLVLFLGIHLVPTIPGTRRTLAARMGDARYKMIFSVLAGIGLVLIALGYWRAGASDRLFAPVPAARAAAPWVVTLAFILLAASHMRGHIRRTLRHPMVIGVILWSAVHLLANGDRRGSILFGAFLAWAIIDLIASLGRAPIVAYEPKARYDAMAIAGGIIVAGIVMMVHQPLFGVRPV
jgi:uncharacterized membrane protein